MGECWSERRLLEEGARSTGRVENARVVRSALLIKKNLYVNTC